LKPRSKPDGEEKQSGDEGRKGEDKPATTGAGGKYVPPSQRQQTEGETSRRDDGERRRQDDRARDEEDETQRRERRERDRKEREERRQKEDGEHEARRRGEPSRDDDGFEEVSRNAAPAGGGKYVPAHMRRKEEDENRKRKEDQDKRQAQDGKRAQEQQDKVRADKQKKQEQKEMKDAMQKAKEDHKNLAKKGTRGDKVVEQQIWDEQKVKAFEEKVQKLLKDPTGKVDKFVGEVDQILDSEELRTVQPVSKLLDHLLRFCREKTESFWPTEQPVFDELVQKQNCALEEMEEQRPDKKKGRRDDDSDEEDEEEYEFNRKLEKFQSEQATERAELTAKRDGGVIDTIQRFAPLFECLIEQAEIRKIRRFKVMLLSECQRLAFEMGLPRLSPSSALLEVFFDGLYQAGIIEEDYFKLWAENPKDETPGKVQSMFQVNIFLDWLAKARVEGEESSDDEEGDAQKKSGDEQSDEEDEESDDDIMANVPGRRGGR